MQFSTYMGRAGEVGGRGRGVVPHVGRPWNGGDGTNKDGQLPDFTKENCVRSMGVAMAKQDTVMITKWQRDQHLVRDREHSQPTQL